MSIISRKRVLAWRGTLQSLLFLSLCTLANSQDWKENLAFAESQHMVIMTDIDQEKYDAVLPDLRKIIELNFPEKYEDRLAKEICIVSDKLRHKGKDELAIEVVDEGLRAVQVKSNKARLYKEKGYIYNKQGNKKLANEMFRKAVELESK